MQISRAMKNDRLMKALTGVSVEEFKELLVTFTQILKEEEKKNESDKKRATGGGRTGFIKPVENKLFFLLFYLKTYPKFDVAGFFFGVVRSCPCTWYKDYLPILKKTLGRECCLPKRKIKSVEEFLEVFPEVMDVLVDASERETQRPKKPKNQKKNYSGKKKKHTRKNTIISDLDRRILYVSPTKAGKVHDKKMVDKEGVLHNIPPWVTKLLDSGYQGVQHSIPNVLIPKKKSKNKPLTPQEKEDNKIISSFRIGVEHVIGGMKRFDCLSNVYRNKNGIDDAFVEVCAGLWNFHVRH